MKFIIPPVIKAILKSCVEFFVFWLASTFPILLGGLYLKLQGNDYFVSVYDLFIKDSVFTYTSTMIAPFFFTLISLLFLKKINGIMFPGFIFIISVITFAVSILLYVSNLSESLYPHRHSPDFKNGLSILCYAIACFIWFYSVLLNNKPEVDLEKKQKINQDKLNKAIANLG